MVILAYKFTLVNKAAYVLLPGRYFTETRIPTQGYCRAIGLKGNITK